MPTASATKRIGGMKERQDDRIARHIPYTRLIDEHTIETKDGAYLRVMNIAGWPFETADPETLDSLKNLRNIMLRGIADGQTAIYSHVVRRKTQVRHIADYDADFTIKLNQGYNALLETREVYENSLYVTVLVRPDFMKKSRGFFSKKKKSDEPDYARQEMLTSIENKSSLLMKNLELYGPRMLGFRDGAGPLGYSETLEFVSELVNGDQLSVAPPQMGIDQYIGNKRLIFGTETCHIRGASSFDEKYGAIISIKEYQAETAAGSLDHLMELPHELVITQSFACLSRKKSLDRLDSVRRQITIAEDSETLAAQLVEAKDAVQMGQLAFGQHHLSVLVKTKEQEYLDNAVRDVINAFSYVGAIAVREDTNLEAAYWAQLPGNFSYIARSAGLSSANLAGLMSLHNYPYGKANDNHWGPCVTIFETLSGTPYHFNFHVGSLGNFTITGPSGSGKTVLLGFLLNMAQKYNPRCFFMDKDRGAELTIRALGGAYAVIRHGVNTGFNPFQLEDTPANRGFLADLTKALVGRTLSPAEERLLSDAIAQNYEAPLEARRLKHFAELFVGYDKDSPIVDELAKWHGAGKHAWLFDNAKDELPIEQRIMGFDLTSILELPELRTPVLMYMFHRIQGALDGTRTLIFIDEGWKALSDPAFEAMIKDWLKTIRKLNGILGIGTQEVTDIVNSPISDTIIEQCPTQIFLPNHKAKSEHYQKAFGLTDGEFSIIKNSPPNARHFLVKQGVASAVAKLDLSGMEDELAIMSGTAKSIGLAEKIWAEHGYNPEDWLPKFQKERRLYND